MLNGGHAEAEGIDRLGERWRLVDPGIFFKQFPVCSGAHAAVELTRRLLAENGIRGDGVRRALCEVPPVVAISLVHDRPRTPQEAQFSMPFAVGAMLARGELGLDCLTTEALSDPAIQAAMGKVEMRRVESLHREASPEGARVTLETADGSVVSGHLEEPLGMPGNPLSDALLHEKFLRCAAAGGLDGAAARALSDHVAGIESAPKAL